MPTKKNTDLAKKRDVDITKEDIEKAKNIVQIKAIERQGNLAAWNDYIGFITSRILGLSGLIVGGLETLDPNILPITLKNPERIAAIGLALLAGKNILTLIIKAEKSLGGRR